MMTYYIGFHVNAFIIAFFHAAYEIYHGRVDTSNWDTPFNVVVPFSTDYIWGWFCKWFFELSASFAYVVTGAFCTSYFVSFCLYIDAICDHFNWVINSIPRYDKFVRNTKHSDNQLSKIRRDIKITFLGAINVHMELYE